jgi:hypothetical protein
MANPNKIKLIKKLIVSAQESIQQAKSILEEIAGSDETKELADKAKDLGKVEVNEDQKIIEGIFDGQNMIGPDGKQYSIPANYASKSKLVEGDTLKLTIMSDGSFVYKQIGPVERKRILGTLIKDESTNEFSVLANSKAYKVLLASITYFKGGVGDEVVILVPKERESDWAAVENIIKKFNQGNSREQLNIDDLG